MLVLYKTMASLKMSWVYPSTEMKMRRFLFGLLMLVGCNFGKEDLNPCIGNDCFCPAQLDVCEPTCDDSGDCNVACGETTCTATCGNVGDCNVQGGQSAAGSVTVLCGNNDLCNVECSGAASCDVTCGGALQCNVACPDGNCTVRECTQGDGICSVVCGTAGGVGVQQGADVVCQ